VQIAHTFVVEDFVEVVFVHAALRVVFTGEALIVLEHLMRSFT
jgi:hypothetical protein